MGPPIGMKTSDRSSAFVLLNLEKDKNNTASKGCATSYGRNWRRDWLPSRGMFAAGFR